MKLLLRLMPLAAILLWACPTVWGTTYVQADRLWANGVVPCKFELAMTGGNRLRVLQAMAIWTAVANVTFVLRTNEPDYVLIQNAPGTSGSRSPTIGRGGGEQDLFIRQDLSGVTDYGLAHELGHVLGFYHTHQRPDRDVFVTYFTNRVDPTNAGNFTVEADALGYPRNAMDYASVMSYPRCQFSTCQGCDNFCDDCINTLAGCRVLQIQDPVAAVQFDRLMGQRTNLTRIDALAMSFLYPPPGWRFVEAGHTNTSESGTFHNPYLAVTNAITSVPNDTTIWVQPGNYRAGLALISKPLILRGPIGNVTIRR